MARKMLIQPGKRRKGRAGSGDVQFGQAKRRGALTRFIFGIYTDNLQDRQRRRLGDYVWFVVLCDAFLVPDFLVVAFFAAALFEAGFFNATFRFSVLASMAGCLDEFDLAATCCGVVVSNSLSDSETA